MTKFLTLLLSLLAGVVFAQNTRFVYQVSMKTDSTAAPTVENAYLDVSGDRSVFYSEKSVQRDSLMRRAMETRNFDRSQMQNYRSQINYQIEKNHSEQKIIYKDRIARDMYSYEEERPFSWKILPETTQIGEYKVQKAETEFAGRNWTAWFTQDVPVMDGPYKFSGLPGLIVKVEDTSGDYSFDLKQTKKMGELPTIQQRGNIITVKRTDFEKQMDKFRKDPASFTTAAMGGRGMRMQQDPQRMKEMQNRLKEEQRKYNNPLEK